METTVVPEHARVVGRAGDGGESHLAPRWLAGKSLDPLDVRRPSTTMILTERR